MQQQELGLDLLAQQFIVHRWHTPLGRQVRDKIVECIKTNKNIQEILAPHVLEHPANVESFDYPYYPPDAMLEKEFWVLAVDDLRGLQFFDEDFSGTNGFSKTNLAYSCFQNCDLSKASFELTKLSFTQFTQCDWSDCIIDKAKAYNSSWIDCRFTNAAFLESNFVDVDWSSSDFRGVYFEQVSLQGVIVNYLTQFDEKLATRWHDRKLPLQQLPDLYKGVRVAYEKAELNAKVDFYLLKEAIANRKYVLWRKLKEKVSFYNGYLWLRDLSWSLISGYGTKPTRTVFLGVTISLLYSFIYYFYGTPQEASAHQSNFITALYFSFTTFATLGYGDISYSVHRPIMRLLSTTEAWLGAVSISLFVVVLARKIFRR